MQVRILYLLAFSQFLSVFDVNTNPKIQQFKELIKSTNTLERFNGNKKENVDKILLTGGETIRNKIDYLLYNGDVDYLLFVLINFEEFEPNVTSTKINYDVLVSVEDPSSTKILMSQVSFDNVWIPSKDDIVDNEKITFMKLTKELNQDESEKNNFYNVFFKIDDSASADKPHGMYLFTSKKQGKIKFTFPIKIDSFYFRKHNVTISGQSDLKVEFQFNGINVYTIKEKFSELKNDWKYVKLFKEDTQDNMIDSIIIDPNVEIDNINIIFDTSYENVFANDKLLLSKIVSTTESVDESLLLNFPLVISDEKGLKSTFLDEALLNLKHDTDKNFVIDRLMFPPVDKTKKEIKNKLEKKVTPDKFAVNKIIVAEVSPKPNIIAS